MWHVHRTTQHAQLETGEAKALFSVINCDESKECCCFRPASATAGFGIRSQVGTCRATHAYDMTEGWTSRRTNNGPSQGDRPSERVDDDLETFKSPSVHWSWGEGEDSATGAAHWQLFNADRPGRSPVPTAARVWLGLVCTIFFEMTTKSIRCHDATPSSLRSVISSLSNGPIHCRLHVAHKIL